MAKYIDGEIYEWQKIPDGGKYQWEKIDNSIGKVNERKIILPEIPISEKLSITTKKRTRLLNVCC